jgi:DNA-binding transcriptional regulator YiaG
MPLGIPDDELPTQQHEALPDFAVAIKSARKSREMSLVEFAALIGYSFSTVSAWERGEYEPHERRKKAILTMLEAGRFVGIVPK